MLKRLASFLVLCVVASAPLSAQVAIDVAKLTCHQFATFKVAHPDKLAIWLNGGDMVVDSQELAGNTDKVKEYCIKNPDLPLIQAVETLFGSAN
jgi:HdeA/HdeB family